MFRCSTRVVDMFYGSGVGGVTGMSSVGDFEYSLDEVRSLTLFVVRCPSSVQIVIVFCQRAPGCGSRICRLHRLHYWESHTICTCVLLYCVNAKKAIGIHTLIAEDAHAGWDHGVQGNFMAACGEFAYPADHHIARSSVDPAMMA